MEAEKLAAEVARLAGLPAERVTTNQPLAPRTSYQIGGPAQLFAVGGNRAEVVALVRAARQLDLPWHILGRGTNLLVADSGVSGLVVANRAEESGLERAGEQGWARADAGAVLQQLAQRACRAGLAGLEWAVEIPGTVGGAVFGNAGAFGGSTSEVVTEAEVLSADGEVVVKAGAELGFAYRTSRFKTPAGRREVILGAKMALRRGRVPELLAAAEANRQQRQHSQPWGRCAGSVFRNPPPLPTGENYSAGYLIEQAGLKGHAIGRARISPVHANFIMNDGGATAAEVWALISLARERVRQQFGVDLDLEVQVWGDIVQEGVAH